MLSPENSSQLTNIQRDSYKAQFQVQFILITVFAFALITLCKLLPEICRVVNGQMQFVV